MAHADRGVARGTCRVARYETVIWVPSGDAADVTRPPAEFDAIAAFLQQCGAQELPDMPTAPNAAAEPMPMLL